MVGAAPVMVTWHLVWATMVVTSESYWELFGATNLAMEVLLGELIKNMLDWDFTAIWRQPWLGNPFGILQNSTINPIPVFFRS